MVQKLYELTCLLFPDFSEEERLIFTKKIEAKIENGKIIKSEIPRRIGLSYPIKKQTAAFLFSIIFETEPQEVEKIKKILEKEVKILRFLLLNKKRIQESPDLNIPKKPAIPSQEDTVQTNELKVNELKTKISAEDQPATAESAREAKKETASKKEKVEKKTTRKKKINYEEKNAELKQIEKDLDKILGVPDDDEQKAKSE